jgi:SAM-dependent methyltransferase
LHDLIDWWIKQAPMKTRESGMPDEEMWESFFRPDEILLRFGLESSARRVVDFGCGYGTFCLAAARMIDGSVLGIDIEAEMVERCRQRALDAGLRNASFVRRDFIGEGSGEADASADFVMLFNILHAERPFVLLDEARRILAPGGCLAVIHWNHDPATPRGPAMNIRPRPEDCRRWMEECGFFVDAASIDLPPWHYGLRGLLAQ